MGYNLGNLIEEWKKMGSKRLLLDWMNDYHTVYVLGCAGGWDCIELDYQAGELVRRGFKKEVDEIREMYSKLSEAAELENRARALEDEYTQKLSKYVEMVLNKIPVLEVLEPAEQPTEQKD